MTNLSRKAARNDLATQIGTVAGFSTGYAYYPTTLDQSPIYSVTGSSVWNGGTRPATNNDFELYVTLWVKRTGDLTAVEDLMDDLIKEVLDVLDTWNNGDLAEPTRGSIELVDGDQWRMEEILIKVDWQV